MNLKRIDFFVCVFFFVAAPTFSDTAPDDNSSSVQQSAPKPSLDTSDNNVTPAFAKNSNESLPIFVSANADSQAALNKLQAEALKSKELAIQAKENALEEKREKGKPKRINLRSSNAAKSANKNTGKDFVFQDITTSSDTAQ